MAIVEKPATKVDAVTLEVLRNGFVQICNEVTITLLKTAHSVIFNEGRISRAASSTGTPASSRRTCRDAPCTSPRCPTP